METKTYLIKTKYDYSTNELVNVDGNNLTIEFKIMDKYTMIEIIGRLKDRTVKEFKHQIICNKNQNIQVLTNRNDQVEKFDEPINENVDRVHFDQVFKNDYQLGLHGQIYEDEYIDPKHTVLKCSHPSPFSAHRGFLGSGHFKWINEYYKQTNQPTIDW